MTETEHAYTLSIEETTVRLGTDPVVGLSGEEAASRLASHGPNELKDRPRRSLVQRLLAQFADFLILVLLTAGVVSALLGEWIDAGAILAIVVINAVLGIVQEGRAERAIEALRKMAAPTARGLRDGTMQKVPASALVPGDVVRGEAGDVVPADGRLVESVSLQIEEASLTGESVPVEKDATVVYTEPRPLGDRANIAYMGTAVT
ncbi:MAG: HAD-IC family P-type ATPase, partial [Clostridiaceae bacterium]|nr:HAD-IC family P-type ATPase [Clostridiaceae bacterium]